MRGASRNPETENGSYWLKPVDYGNSTLKHYEPKPKLMKLYLAGPMSGYPEHNFPLFLSRTAELRAKGYDILSPAEIEPNPDGESTWVYYMRKCVVMVAQSDAVAVLPGWENSRGATVEVGLARNLEMPILDSETLEEI